MEAETEAEGRGQRRSLLLPAVAHRRKMGLRQRSDFSPFVLYLFCGFLMGRSVKNIVNHHCFVGFSLHSVFKLDEHYGRNDFFFFQNPFYCYFTICFVGFSLHSVFRNDFILFFFRTHFNTSSHQKSTKQIQNKRRKITSLS